MSILGGMSAAEFKSAVVAGDIDGIARTKGIGKKTAERIVLELKDKVGVAEVWEAANLPGGGSPEQTARNDAVLALISLGYKQADARKAVDAGCRESDQSLDSTDAILRAALRQLQ